MTYAIGRPKVEVPSLDPAAFDALTSTDRKLWGLAEISGVLGVSVDTVRRWVNDPKCSVPVAKRGGRWFAFRSGLVAWLHSRMP